MRNLCIKLTDVVAHVSINLTYRQYFITRQHWTQCMTFTVETNVMRLQYRQTDQGRGDSPRAGMSVASQAVQAKLDARPG